jgi:F-type H+-transporting ATPase subunit b
MPVPPKSGTVLKFSFSAALESLNSGRGSVHWPADNMKGKNHLDTRELRKDNFCMCARPPMSEPPGLSGERRGTLSSRSFLLVLFWTAGMLVLPESVSAAEEGNKWGIWLDIGRFFNLALVVVVLIWVTRKPLAGFFSGRTQAIREQLAEAQKARQEAETRLAEMESRMSRLDDELREIRNSAEAEAREEYRRLVAAAERDAEKTMERSRQEIEGMTKAAHQELKLRAAELSIELAEEKIRREITGADRERLLSGFVAKLGEKE